MPKQNEREWAAIGKVVALFGLHGELKVRLLTDIPDRFAQLEVVYLGPDYIRYRIDATRPHKGELIVLKLLGIDDANSAEMLRNLDISIPLSELAQLPPDSYYQHDIIGLCVYTVDDRELGKIVDIMVTGGNDVYVIKTAEGRQALIPAIKQVIKQIDLIRHTMHIDLMPGLLDNSGEEEKRRKILP